MGHFGLKLDISGIHPELDEEFTGKLYIRTKRRVNFPELGEALGKTR